MALVDRITAYREVVEEWLRGLYHGMISHPAYELIEKEAEDTEDVFMLACFPDAFLEDEFEAWERRMWDRGSVLERKGAQYHF